VIGFDRPFVSSASASTRPGARARRGDGGGNFDTVVADAIAQVEAGRRCSTSTRASRSPTSRRSSRRPISSCSRHRRAALDRLVDRRGARGGLAVYQGKPLVNSVTGEEERSRRVLPLVAKHGAAVVAITNDETGISEDPDVRFEVARKIVSRAEDHGIRARTSSSTRSSCRSARWAPPAARCSGSSGGCATSSA
jgi:5-methyltetrahydrofolate--homocysteine methyltransferase